MSAAIMVEVVFALPARQRLVEVSLDHGATVADAIEASGLKNEFPDVRLDELQTGVWGRAVRRDHALSDGDRVEIYRPLERDPRDARRLLAEHQRSGSNS